MSAPTGDGTIMREDAKREADMAKYGITRVPVDYFHYRNYRYTSLGEAIAEAKRQTGANGSDRRQ